MSFLTSCLVSDLGARRRCSTIRPAIHPPMAGSDNRSFASTYFSSSNSRSLPPLPSLQTQSKSRKKRLQKKLLSGQHNERLSHFTNSDDENALSLPADLNIANDAEEESVRISSRNADFFISRTPKQTGSDNIQNNRDESEDSDTTYFAFQKHETSTPQKPSENVFPGGSDVNNAPSVKPKVKAKTNTQKKLRKSSSGSDSTVVDRKSKMSIESEWKSSDISQSVDEGNHNSQTKKKQKRRKANRESDEREGSHSQSPIEHKEMHDSIEETKTSRNGVVMLPIIEDFEHIHSEPVGKLFVEHNRGFKAVSRRAQFPSATVKTTNSIETFEEFIHRGQKWFRKTCLFCHGILAGLALWQCIVSHFLGPQTHDHMDFIRHYSPVAHIFKSVFYALSVICVVSVFERYDVAHPKTPSLKCALSFPYWLLTLLIYPVMFAVNLSISDIDDKLGLHQYNSTLWDNMDAQEVKSSLHYWQTMNWIRCAAALIGWLGMTISPKGQKLQIPPRMLPEDVPTFSHMVAGPV